MTETRDITTVHCQLKDSKAMLKTTLYIKQLKKNKLIN